MTIQLIRSFVLALFCAALISCGGGTEGESGMPGDSGASGESDMPQESVMPAESIMPADAAGSPAIDLAITNARVFTATGDDVMEGATILIAGDRIESVSTGEVDAEAAQTIDAAGRTVMPGLIDGHVHVFFDLREGPNFPRNDAQAVEFADGFMAELLESYLDNGYTSILSPIDFWPQITDVRARAESGDLRSPRLFIAGGVFVAPGGHYVCRALEGEEQSWCDEHVSVVVDSAEAARAGVRDYAEQGVDLIVYDSRTNAPEFQTDVVAGLVEEADAQGLRILVHGSNMANVEAMVAAGIDGFVHPPADTQDMDGSLAALAGESGIPVAITIGEQEEEILSGNASDAARASYEIMHANVAHLLEAGAVPIFASDMPGAGPERTRPIVVRAMTGFGLSNAEVLRAATRDAAQAYIGQADLGTIEAGQLADIIIVDGDPLADLGALENVATVIKGGEVVVSR